MTRRRTLDYDRIDAIMPDVNRLLEGHTTAGNWTLGEICDHLTRAIRRTLSNPPPIGPATPEQEEARRKFFRDRVVPQGIPITVPELIPDPAIDPRTAAEGLRDALASLEASEGPWPNHRLLGPLTRDEWFQFHCAHCAHHLSFAHPA
jgi:Protein of unknown function (DUF1569)